MKMGKVKLLAFGLLSCWSGMAVAASEGHVTKIERLMSDNEYYGGCMVFTAVQPAIDCPAKWFSMDCDGNFNSKDASRRMWDTAQLAYAMGVTVDVYISDSKKLNGYCVVDRLVTHK